MTQSVTEIEKNFPPGNIRLYTKRNIAKMILNCFTLGTGVFFTTIIDETVDIEGHHIPLSSLNVDLLKKYIWSNRDDFKDFASNYDMLELWMVSIPTVDNENYEQLKENPREDLDIEQIFGGYKLDPSWKLVEFFSNPQSNHIHIIVKLTGCYLPRQGGLGGTMLPIDLKVKSTNEGVCINDPDICPRFDVISSLINYLEDKHAILVRAPPFSGKTSIAQILEDKLVHAPEFSDRRIIRVSMIWAQSVGVKNCFEEFNVLWKNIMGIDWISWVGQCRYIKTILIIDEAQMIYGKSKDINPNNLTTADQFWMTVKGSLQELPHIKIIMFAAYGYRSSNNTGLTTPFALPEANCKGLTDINFTPSELKKHVEKFSSNYFKNLDQQSVSNLYEYIQKVTGGHVGLVCHILKTTEDAMRNQIDNSCLTWEKIFKHLNSEDFNRSIYTDCRAVPEVSALSAGQITICEEVYLNEKCNYTDFDKDAVDLVRSGILIIVTIEKKSYLTFAAPLLKRLFFQQNYGVHNSAETTPTDLHHFIVKIFTAMCNKLSKKILRDTLGFGSDGRILEQTWQKEFYRIGTQVLGKKHFLSCDVGSVFGCGGKVDFYVDGLDWAIELLRDGEDMAKHKKRFESTGGEYEEVVTYAKSIAIIDIRSIGILDTRSEVKKVRNVQEDFIYVSCSKEFDAFKIESFGKETVIISFQD